MNIFHNYSVKISEPVNQIVLNAVDLDCSSATLSFNTEKLAATDTQVDEKNERVSFVFNKTLNADTDAILHIQFSGTISEKLAGFYRSAYKDLQGNQK
jgi:aminopeptidase 2